MIKLRKAMKALCMENSNNSGSCQTKVGFPAYMLPKYLVALPQVLVGAS